MRNIEDFIGLNAEVGEECGVIGAVDLTKKNRDVMGMVLAGGSRLQHRGHLSAGAASWNPDRRKKLMDYKSNGTVRQVFKLDDAEAHGKVVDPLRGPRALMHLRYLTSGLAEEDMAQPWVYQNARAHKRFAMIFNGNIANKRTLQQNLIKEGIDIEHDIDTEVLLLYLAYFNRSKTPTSMTTIFRKLQQEIDGAMNMILLNAAGHFASYRDPLGFRPLVWGVTPDGILMTASESVALEPFMNEFESVEPGQLLWVPPGAKEPGFHKITDPDPSLCKLELAYYADEASIIDDINVYLSRRHEGEKLAKAEQEPIGDDCVVISVPESGNPSAEGFADELGIPKKQGLSKNSAAGRTYIDTDPRAKAREKFSVVRGVMDKKRVFVVDDTFIRGNTFLEALKLIVEKSDPSEIHIRIPNPAVIHPCFYGMKHDDRNQLFVSKYMHMLANGHIPEEVEQMIIDELNEIAKGKVKSIKFAPTEKKYEVIKTDVHAPGAMSQVELTRNLCDACMSGRYRTPYGKNHMRRFKASIKATSE